MTGWNDNRYIGDGYEAWIAPWSPDARTLLWLVQVEWPLAPGDPALDYTRHNFDSKTEAMRFAEGRGAHLVSIGAI